MPHTSIEGQALTDFITEFSNVLKGEPPKESPWELFVDGSSTGDRFGAGDVLISPE